MVHSLTMLAYLGPETMLPMTSVVAGVAGVLMMFGRNSIRWTVGLFRSASSILRKKKAEGSRPIRRIATGEAARG